MVFVTAGMGGGTGTGGAPVIASIAKEMNILTVGIVTIPFSNEGPKRKQQAEEGLDRLRESVDALIIICNDKLREMYGNLTLSTAFLQADNVLATAARGIAEMISVHGTINVDFRDVSTVMKDSGVAIMGSAVGEGDNRAVKAVELALASPLLNDNKITGARYVLLNITTGKEEPLLDEITDISDYVQQEAGNIANVIMGVSTDESLEDALSVTIIAAGFETNPDLGFVGPQQPERIVRNLSDPSQPTIVHQLDDKDPEENKEPKSETKEPVTPEEEAPIFPPLVGLNPTATHNVIEDTPERKVYELKMDDDEETHKAKPADEEEMKLVVKDEPVVKEEKIEAKEDASVEKEEETPAADETEAKEETPVKEETTPTAEEEDRVEAKEVEPVTEELEEEVLDEAAARKKAELDAVLSQFPTPSKQEKPKVEASDKKEDTPEVKKDDLKIEEQEVVGKAEQPTDKSSETTEDTGEIQEANIPEFKLMGDSDSGEKDAKSDFEFDLSTDTGSGLSSSSTSLSDISSDDSDPLSSTSLGDASELSSYSSPNSMDQSERISKLKELSYKLRTPSGVSDLEEQPAYMRRNVDLDDVPHSSKSEVSRYTLNDTEDGEDKVELKPDNPFLHDNVD